MAEEFCSSEGGPAEPTVDDLCEDLLDYLVGLFPGVSWHVCPLPPDSVVIRAERNILGQVKRSVTRYPARDAVDAATHKYDFEKWHTWAAELVSKLH